MSHLTLPMGWVLVVNRHPPLGLQHWAQCAITMSVFGANIKYLYFTRYYSDTI